MGVGAATPRLSRIDDMCSLKETPPPGSGSTVKRCGGIQRDFSVRNPSHRVPPVRRMGSPIPRALRLLTHNHLRRCVQQPCNALVVASRISSMVIWPLPSASPAEQAATLALPSAMFTMVRISLTVTGALALH